jgi:DNA-binding beta-propeller fold protein YncE
LAACRGFADAPVSVTTPAATTAPIVVQTATAAPLLSVPGATRADGLQEEWRLPVPSPNGLASDSHGRIYTGSSVSDSHVRVFDQRGLELARWGGVSGRAPGEFDYITSLALDGRGTSTSPTSTISASRKFDPSGRPLLVIPTEPPVGLTGVALDAAGFIYVANHRRHDHTVQKFDPSGKLVAAWGEPGTGPGQFAAGSTGGPDQVALDVDGNAYVSDPDNQRVQKFDRDGHFQRTFGDARGDGHFSGGPYGLAVDREGNVYGAELGGTIRQFNSDGQVVATWRDTGASRVIVVDDSGALYVRDQGPPRAIRKYRQP